MTLSELIKSAPAVRKLEKPKAGQIDTYAFLAYLKKAMEYEPLFAAQGTPHGDSKGLSKGGRQGKHFVAAMAGKGFTLGLLNSHTVRRKAWIAGGFARDGEQPLFLVAAAIPVQRWRGYEAAIDDMLRYRATMMALRKAMTKHAITAAQMETLAQLVSENAYLPGHKPIDPAELISAAQRNLFEHLFWVLGRMHVSGLLSADQKRKVKPLRGPDALLQAGNEVFQAGMAILASRPGSLPIALPRFVKT